MNSNLLFFIAFLIIFLVLSILQIEMKSEYFLSQIINNPVWRFIILAIVLFIFGKKYIDNIKNKQ